MKDPTGAASNNPHSKKGALLKRGMMTSASFPPLQ